MKRLQNCCNDKYNDTTPIDGLIYGFTEGNATITSAQVYDCHEKVCLISFLLLPQNP